MPPGRDSRDVKTFSYPLTLCLSLVSLLALEVGCEADGDSEPMESDGATTGGETGSPGTTNPGSSPTAGSTSGATTTGDASTGSTTTTGTDMSESESESEGESEGESESEGETETGADDLPHPLCDCVPEDYAGLLVECQQGILDCGTFRPFDADEDRNLPDGCEYVEDELDCSELDAANQAVVDCTLEAAAERTPFVVERVRTPAFTDSLDRQFRIEPGFSLDLPSDSLDLIFEWTDQRVVVTPDLQDCAGDADGDAQWVCIEAQFDAARTEAVCVEAGSDDTYS